MIFMNKKLFLFFLFFSVFTIAFLGFIFHNRTVNNRTVNNRNGNEIIISQAFDNLLYIGLYVADEGGFFKKEGLNVKINTAGGDAQAMAALTSGNCHFAQCDPAFVAIANEGGWDGRVVGVVVDKAAFWGVTFNKSINPIETIDSLKGKKIAVYAYPNTAYVIQKELLDKAGLQIGKDVYLIEVPFGTELATLKDGRADIAQTLEPNVSTVEQQGGHCVLSYPEIYSNIAFSGLIASKEYLMKNGETVKKFIRAYNTALAYIHDHPDAASRIAVNHFSEMDSIIVADAVKRLVSSNSISKSTFVNEDAWNNLLKIRLSVGDIKAMPKINLIDNSYQIKYEK